MIQDFLRWMLYHTIYFLIFPIGIAIYRYRFIKKERMYVIAFLGLGLLTELTATWFSEIFGTNLPILHLYTVLEFNLIALFYFSFFGYFYNRRLVPSLMVFFTGFAVLNSLFIQKITEFNTYSRGLEALLVIIFSLLCFYKLLIELSSKNPTQQPIFWINTGFLLYFAGNLVLFILSNVILKENKAFNYMSWGLHSCLIALLYILIGIGLWNSPHQK